MSGVSTGQTESGWCAVANMGAINAFGPDGSQIREGSKHFLPGTKLYVISHFWGMAGEVSMVLGRHRSSKRYVKMVVTSSWLVNWRAELVYSPHIVSELRLSGEYDRDNPGSTLAKKRAEEIARLWIERGARTEPHLSTRVR